MLIGSVCRDHDLCGTLDFVAGAEPGRERPHSFLWLAARAGTGTCGAAASGPDDERIPDCNQQPKGAGTDIVNTQRVRRQLEVQCSSGPRQGAFHFN